MPPDLTPTIRECVHLVTRGHFRSRNKDGGHTIRSAMAVNPMLHANFMAVCFVERELCLLKFYITLGSLGYMFVTGSMALTLTDLMQMSFGATEFSEIMQNNGHYAFQGHSRSPALVPI